MPSRSLLDLRQPFRDQAGEWAAACGGRGVPVLIHCTLRSSAEQDALYQVGRRGVAGEAIVTNARAGQSWHNYGAAFDAVPWLWYLEAGRPEPTKKLDWSPFVAGVTTPKWLAAIATSSKSDELLLLDPGWRVMVEEADRLGLDWSGRWQGFREYVHFQLAGVTLEQLKAAA